MKTIWKKCDKCDGQGYFPLSTNNSGFPPTTVPPITTPIIVSEETKCRECNGTGRIIIGYIDEQ